jgi:RNase P/RNase MRP subunit p29
VCSIAAVVPKAGCVFELRLQGRVVLLHGGNLAAAQAAAAPRPRVSKARRAVQPNQQRPKALSWEL